MDHQGKEDQKSQRPRRSSACSDVSARSYVTARSDTAIRRDDGRLEIPPGAHIGYRGVDNLGFEHATRTGHPLTSPHVNSQLGPGVYAGVGTSDRIVADTYADFYSTHSDGGHTLQIVNGQRPLVGREVHTVSGRQRPNPDDDFLMAPHGDGRPERQIVLTKPEDVVAKPAPKRSP